MSIAKHLQAAVLLALLVLVGNSGCGGARYVVQDQYGGVVAIPSNTNYWPTHYRDEAERLMKQRCPYGYVIDREEEVLIGQTTSGSTNTDTRAYDLPGGKRSPSGSLMATTTNRSEVTQDQTEYRITFHAATGARVNGLLPASAPVVVPASVPAGLPSTPVPAGN